ncbi:MAG: C25 family cysteine peptidase [Candidatus Kariarchaeaceae archaeon]|jgi:hypothetical protein
MNEHSPKQKRGKTRPSLLKIAKVIISHLGEVTHDTRTVGDQIRYKIYYENTSKKAVNFILSDPLATELTNISPLHNGQYDEPTHTITWKIHALAPNEQRSVEFIATISPAKTIRNQAFAKISRRAAIETNTVVTQVFVSPKLGWIPFHSKSQPGNPPHSVMKDETTMGITVNFDISGMFVQELKVDDVIYHTISIPGQARRMTLGKPELPIVGQIIEIPHGVNFKSRVVKSQSISLKGYNIHPAQKPIPRESSAPDKSFTIDRETYLSDTSYPTDLVTIQKEDIGVIRGHRIVLLKVNPLQLNPVTRHMQAFSNIEVRLDYDHPAQITRADKRLESTAFEEMLQGVILNYKNRNRFPIRESRKDKQPGCDYLILTPAAFYVATDANNPLVRFKNWKQQKGLKTRIVDVATITGGNTSNSIVSYIQNVYDNWNPPPTYILLVGDADFIPTNDGEPHGSHLDNANNPTLIGTDLHYVTVDGNDYFPDIFIGRLSVETLAEAGNVIDKIIAYEQNPPPTPANDDYYTDMSMVCLFEDVTPDNPVPQPDGEGREDNTFQIIECAEAVRNHLIGQGYNVDRIYDQSGGWAQGPQRYMDGTALPNDLLMNPPAGIQPFPWNGNTNDIRNSINGGNFIVTYNGHGGRTNWGRPAFNTINIQALTNGNLTPVVFSFACQTGWFDNETDHADLGTGANAESFCELFLRQAGNGTVAIIGSTRNSWENNDFMMMGVFKALWPDFTPVAPASITMPQMQMGPLVRMGQIHDFCKFYMANRYLHDFHRQSSFEMYHLFGDPEMPVWTSAPLTLNVDHPVGIGSLGEQDFIVTVTDSASGSPIQGAVVTLTQRQTVAGNPVDVIRGTEQTNPAGITRFTLHSIPSGDLDLTVTAHNYRYYSGVIVVSPNGGTVNRLDPDNGIEGHTIHIGGQGFSGTETVDIYFGNQLIHSTATVAGDFGQPGANVSITIPTPYNLGPVNVLVHGQTSNRYAIDVFQVRSANPIDLYTYSQQDSSTWHLHPGDNPTWNNPEIQLYDGATAVASNNLIVGRSYTAKLNIHNDTDFTANAVKTVYKWRNYGIGGPWYGFHTDSRNVLANQITESQAPFTPAATGHLCMSCEIYHIEDINVSNNSGQENLHVGPTSSPTEVCFLVWNMTRKPASMFLEVRQLITPNQRKPERLWGTWVKHPDPQILQPGERAEACVIVDPDLADVKPGTTAEFAVTGFINREMIGGVNIRLTKNSQIKKK